MLSLVLIGIFLFSCLCRLFLLVGCAVVKLVGLL